MPTPDEYFSTDAQNLEAVLKGAGCDLSHVIKANVYLSNLPKDFDAVNEVSCSLMRCR